MSETDNKPTLGRKPLGLKRSVETGEVKQTFSHGRTNKVVVEVKQRKLIRKPGDPAPAPEAAPAAPPPPPVAAPVQPAPPPPPPSASRETRQEMQTRLLREAEEQRLRLAEDNRRREEEARARALEDERKRAEDSRKVEAAPAPTPAPEPEPVASPVVEAQAAASAPAPATPAAEVAEAPATAPAQPVIAPRRFTPVPSAPAPKRPEPAAAKKPTTPSRDRKGADERRGGKLTVTRALNEDEGARARSLAALKRAREKERRAHFAGQSQQREKQSREVQVPEAITVQELANRMAEKGADLVKALFKLGMMVTV